MYKRQIKEWVGSYTELREMQKAREVQAQRTKSAETVAKKVEVPLAKTAVTGTKGAKKKMSFGERNELKRLDAEIPALEKKKEELLLALAKGGTDHHKIMELSLELEKVIASLDKQSERWLELTEKAEQEGAG